MIVYYLIHEINILCDEKRLKFMKVGENDEHELFAIALRR